MKCRAKEILPHTHVHGSSLLLEKAMESGISGMTDRLQMSKVPINENNLGPFPPNAPFVPHQAYFLLFLLLCLYFSLFMLISAHVYLLNLGIFHVPPLTGEHLGSSMGPPQVSPPISPQNDQLLGPGSHVGQSLLCYLKSEGPEVSET